MTRRGSGGAVHSLADWVKRLEPRFAATPEAGRSHAEIDLDLDASVRDLYDRRVEAVFHEKYAGIPMLKFAEDQRAYERILWQGRVDVVVELGTFRGGSALWFRDRLNTLASYGHISSPRVITIDLEVEDARTSLTEADPSWEESIDLIAGDVRDPSLAERVREMVPPDSACLVVDDSGHTFETTMGALRGYSDLIGPGGFMVIEDTVNDVTEMRRSEDWPLGTLSAIEEWLATDQGSRFRIRRDLELYGLTCHPMGFLQRVG